MTMTDYDLGFEPRTYLAPDGLRLYARDYGYQNPTTKDRIPLVCLPGLTRNSRDFHQLALMLSADPSAPRRVVTLDYRGRGFSEWDKDKSHYNLLVEAEDVLAAAAALDIPRAAFLGTSRGGLTLHLLAGLRPALLSGVVLNDIGPVIEGVGLAQIKAYLGRDRKPVSWPDAADILKEIHGRAFPALGDQDWLDMAQCIYVDIKGKLEPDFDPAIAEQLKDVDLSSPLPTLWPQFQGFTGIPAMVIRGENSALLSLDTVAEMKKRYPDLRILTAVGQGHAPLPHIGTIGPAIRDFIATLPH